MATAEITVMGAGIFGLSVAYACLRRGAGVQVIDPYGVAAGASGGIVGALAPHVPEQWNSKKAFQFDSLMMQQDHWDGVAQLTGLPTGYARAGRLQPLADDAAITLAKSRAAGADKLWQGRASWSVIAAPQDGWTPASPSGFVIQDTLTAQIHPRHATQALAAAVTALGGTIHADAPARGQIVWATGHKGLQAMTAQHSRLVGAGVKGQAALLEFDAAGLPQLYADTLHIVPHHDGTVAIGSTSERAFTTDDQTDAQLDDIITRARLAVPILRDAPVIARWAGVRPRSRSRAPMLGHHPFRKGEYVANGGFKIGFGMAPKVGEVMADLILENDASQIPEAFLAERNL